MQSIEQQRTDTSVEIDATGLHFSQFKARLRPYGQLYTY